MTDAGLRISGLCKSFGPQQVLVDADLEVPEGSLTAILGSSGSGKTTLLRLLAGFDQPDSGRITIGGDVVDDGRRHVRPRDRRVGYVPQEGALFPHLDVAANVAFGLGRARRRTELADLLDLAGLSELARRYPHELSGGQQQRVALARALAIHPRLVLLDEPFSALDAALRASVRADVVAVLRAAGTTAVLVTHDQDEALSLADRVSVLRHGRFAQSGTPEEIYARPLDADMAAFVGDANLLTGVERDGLVVTAIGALAVAGPPPATGAHVTVMVRPEQIDLVDADGVAGTVVGCTYYGHDTVLTVEPAGGAGPVKVRLIGSSPLRPGSAVQLRPRGPISVFDPDRGGPPRIATQPSLTV